jgi:hypothetical protein
MFRDSPDNATSIDEESVVMADHDSPVVSPEREKELDEQLTDGSALLPPICGALTRRGTICFCKKLYKNGRCKFHGGLSTGPKSPEGKAKAALNLRNTRRRTRRQAKASSGETP